MRFIPVLSLLATTLTTTQANLFGAGIEAKASLWKLFDEARAGYVTDGKYMAIYTL